MSFGVGSPIAASSGSGDFVGGGVGFSVPP
jgi:hypothetical protein